MTESTKEARIAHFRTLFDGFREDAAREVATRDRQRQFHAFVNFLSEECVSDEMCSLDDELLLEVLSKDFGPGLFLDLFKWGMNYGLPAKAKTKVEAQALA